MGKSSNKNISSKPLGVGSDTSYHQVAGRRGSLQSTGLQGLVHKRVRNEGTLTFEATKMGRRHVCNFISRGACKEVCQSFNGAVL